MSSAISYSVLSELMSSIREGMQRYLPESSDKGLIFLESSALLQVSHASLKNAPYAFLEQGFSPLQMLSTRVTYLESVFISLVSMITNYFFAVIYTFFTVLTLGLSESIRSRCKVYWMHGTYGLVGTGIGFCGMIKPYFGVGLNGLLLLSTIRDFNQCCNNDVSRSEKNLVKFIKKIIEEKSPIAYDFFQNKYKVWDYESVVAPSLRYIEHTIVNAKRIRDLTNLAWNIFWTWPKVKSLDSDKKDKHAKLGSPAAHHHYDEK